MTKRGKVQLKRIEDRTSRQVRFSKRRSGLFKKAFELAVLCDVEVALVVFSPAGKLYEFSTSSIESTFNRYKQTMLVNEGTDYLQINCEDASTSTEFLNRSDFLQWFSSRNIDQMDVRELDEFGATLTETLREIKSRMLVMERASIERLEKVQARNREVKNPAALSSIRNNGKRLRLIEESPENDD